MSTRSSAPRESAIERHLVQRCAEIGVLCLKFTSPGHVGVPDRVLMGHDANDDSVTLFVEVKRPDEAPRPSQVAMIRRMRDHGQHAVVADSKASVDALISDYFTHPTVPIAKRDPHAAPLPGRTGAVITALR
ncbi:VRR-NUC domain protein [Gordonia bronchialis DSM 43247]|uniref:VRR-NUC domain protein n=1 Tax=Gordonia bronchialis (strain ATCC 25592 / DSM 43247 / BCRC 13721 / JCM 3198 / KCTC 3076 / NBRC 16047 / NCTC 10667) TaxID=526226 RepID=D0LED5_GORB4|nr:VRR-NUC domain-containing protein [Gordonia bronchialis]ACY19853.1 VRR-NUC domain protein [Gordonia bronchialis DSM 43247]MCC3322627.1 VRR-NUC domain-containing protein [Gordonia bronchialis]QGS26275.1 VRR-NUC domain-containing protein [Gordonia bronchialis]STQ62630.1 VRR-NUC domain [Gordonia bronchialis]